MLLRAGCYGCLLVGAAREISGFWELRTRTAVLEERRRVARDLHDGLAQELTFILAQARRPMGLSRTKSPMAAHYRRVVDLAPYRWRGAAPATITP